MFNRKHEETVDPERLVNPCREIDVEPTYRYVALLDCGHYFKLTKSWNIVIENPSPGWPRPTTAYCRYCSNLGHPSGTLMRDVVEFGRLDEENIMSAARLTGFALFNLTKQKYDAVDTLLRKVHVALTGKEWDSE